MYQVHTQLPSWLCKPQDLLSDRVLCLTGPCTLAQSSFRSSGASWSFCLLVPFSLLEGAAAFARPCSQPMLCKWLQLAESLQDLDVELSECRKRQHEHLSPGSEPDDVYAGRRCGICRLFCRHKLDLAPGYSSLRVQLLQLISRHVCRAF